MNGDHGTQNDAIISVESTAEWQVHDILYDGQERYVAPLTFSDYVAKYARKVDWRKLVGSETSADDYNDDEADEEPDAVDDQQQPETTSGDTELQRLLTGSTDEQAEVEIQQQRSGLDESEEAETDGGETIQQGVGPWDSVAKRLLQSLTEMNVLLDAIQVARNGKYLVFDPVQQEPIEQPKGAVLAAKKKALASASIVLASLADQVRPKGAVISPSAHQQLDPELEELMEMRRHWRLKKVGNTIVGDLSYFSVGKYRPNATFEVRKAEKSQSTITKGQMWKVIMPKDLEEALNLRIVIEQPDGGLGDAIDYFGKRPYPKVTTDVGWQEKLQLAQRTLFCRDLFAQLAREAAHVPNLCCAVRGRSIIIRLPHGQSLCISLDVYASQTHNQESDPPQSSTHGTAFVLEHNLQRLFDAELKGANRIIIPRPVAAPLTHLSKKARLAGPEALSATALASESDSDKLLLERLLDQTRHFLFYQQCKMIIDGFASTCNDPTIAANWCPETTGVWSMVRIQMMTPYYDFCGRALLILEIHVDDIKATLRDGEVLTLSSNLQELAHFLKLRARQHIVSAVGTLCRPHQWQTLYSNPCQVDNDGLAPAIMVGHPAGTSAIYIRYPLVGDPVVMLQTASNSTTRFAGDVLSSNKDNHQLWSCIRDSLRRLCYEELPGNNFLHKIELLVATLT